MSSSQLTFLFFRGGRSTTNQFSSRKSTPRENPGGCRWLNCHWQMSTSPNDFRAMKNGPFIDGFITYMNIMVCLAIKHQLLKCQRVFQKLRKTGENTRQQGSRVLYCVDKRGSCSLVDPVPIHVGSLKLEPYPKVAADKNIWIYLYYIYTWWYYVCTIYIYCTHILCTYMYTYIYIYIWLVVSNMFYCS